MIAVDKFYDSLKQQGIDFFTGVPDSLLKDICACITARSPEGSHVIAANEGGAVALGAGYHLATGRLPLIYMQNSGIGNAVNPLLSLADKEVYSVPMLLLIGWRGAPGVKDEPQHIKQGRVLTDLLAGIEIPWYPLDANSDYESVIATACCKASKSSAPVAIVVHKGAFMPYKLSSGTEKQYELTREEALSSVVNQLPENSIVVSTTGMLSRELFEVRERNHQTHANDFLTVGSMGHTLSIATGIAMAKPERYVYCLDGDGSALMHLGSYGIAGSLPLKNLRIVIFNNGAHDSVGGQPTIGEKVDFESICKAFDIRFFGAVNKPEELISCLQKLNNTNGPAMIEIKVRKGARHDLGRPTSTPLQNKKALMEVLKNGK